MVGATLANSSFKLLKWFQQEIWMPIKSRKFKPKDWFLKRIDEWLPPRYLGILFIFIGLLFWEIWRFQLRFTQVLNPIEIIAKEITDVVFWGLIAYQVGVSVFVGLNSSIYILRQSQRLPMKVDPLSNFRRLAPLEEIARRSTQLILVIILGSLTIMISYILSTNQVLINERNLVEIESSIQENQFALANNNTFSAADDALLRQEIQQLQDEAIVVKTNLNSLKELEVTLGWLLVWVGIGITLLLIVMGVMTSFYSRSVLVSGIMYVFLNITIMASGITALNLPITNSLILVLDPRILLTGLYLTYIVYVHTREAGQPIRNIRQRAKDNLLKNYDSLISQKQKALLKFETTNPQNEELLTHIIENIKHINELREKVQGTNTNIRSIFQTLSILSPFVTSIFLPFILETVASRLIDLII
jgi:hypothetical protein